MNSEQAKQIPLSRILDQLGHQPVRQEHGRNGTAELRYSSPFRTEKDPSFNVNIERNVWHDFGHQGGNVLDFVMEYYGINDISSALRQLENLMGQQRIEPVSPTTTTKTTSTPLEVQKIQRLQNRALTEYLKGRGISAATARPHIQEIYYTRKGKDYFALAFKNESEGYELRNPYFKGVYGSKDITIVERKNLLAKRKVGEGVEAVTVFEGFIDFLSALTHYGRDITTPVIVMNSTALKERTVEAIKEMEVSKVYLYLDRDKAGRGVTQHFKNELRGVTIVDNSSLYAGYDDFNEFLMKTAQKQRT